MKQIFARAALMLLVLVLAAPIFPVGALALSGRDALLRANLDAADFQFEYVPQANSEYALFLFSADGGDVRARAQIFDNGQEIASGVGSGQICSARLVKDHTYTVRVHGRGSAILEMARCALSRSQAQPLILAENEPYEKMIAHEFDAHWYAFTAAETGPVMISCVPQGGIAMRGMLFDADGACISELDALGDIAALRADTVAGRDYFLRVCAPEGGEGGYAVTLHRPEDNAAPAFDSARIVVSAGSQANLAAEAGRAALLWISGDETIARVTQNGMVLGLREGETVITAHGISGSAEISVRVEFVPLQGLEFIGERLTLSAGDDNDLWVDFYPENASDTRVRFDVADPAIAAVNDSGVVRALQPGETTITVSSADGALSDTISLTVTEAVRRYRALIVGEENYPFAEDTRREGSENSVQAVKNLLGTVEFENAAYLVRAGQDLSRAELIAALRRSFSGAAEKDVSLLYITCHGFYSGGMSFLELSDGSVLSVRDLEAELRKIPGTVVVIIDSCASGGAIGAASDRANFARGVNAAFAASGIRGGKYRVICSAGLDQDSFRIALGDGESSSVMTTVFARALCDGAGWDIDRDQRGTMGADFNYDGKITMAEMQIYLQERVNWYMDIVSGITGQDYRQSVQVYPQGDPLVLFERKP